MVTLAAIGGLLGGIGQAAGGAAGLFGGGSSGTPAWATAMQRADQREFFERNLQAQKDFAQQGIRWKVDDAKAAGLHPLAALGMQGSSFSPVNVLPFDAPSRGGSSMSSDLANMGQGVQRALASTQTQRERDADAARLATENATLQNDLLRAQIASINARTQKDQIGPPMPGSVGIGQHNYTPAETVSPRDRVGVQEAGPSMPGNRYIRLPGGIVQSIPPKDANMDEVTSPGALSYAITNRLLPLVSADARREAKPPRSMLPDGAYDWDFTPLGWVARYHTTKYKEPYRNRYNTPYARDRDQYFAP